MVFIFFEYGHKFSWKLKWKIDVNGLDEKIKKVFVCGNFLDVI